MDLNCLPTSANKISVLARQANNYINNVEKFFDEGNPNPTALNEFIAEAKKLDSKAMSYNFGIMKELNSKK